MGLVDVTLAAQRLRGEVPESTRIAVVLGSGLRDLVDSAAEPRSIPFESVPGFPAAGVVGHEGRYVVGRLGEADVLFQCGRYHLYEGHGLDIVAAPVRVAAALGIETFVFTNAAGGIRADLEAGDLVLLEDHINAMFRNPLIGPVRDGETRFPDMSAPYDPGLQEIALDAAGSVGVSIARGVYAGVPGPSYETRAEVRMLGRMGADVVGMSTVPEVIVARALGLRCLAFSVVTNKATGLGSGALSHDEVVAIGREAGHRLARVLSAVIPRLDPGAQSAGAK